MEDKRRPIIRLYELVKDCIPRHMNDQVKSILIDDVCREAEIYACIKGLNIIYKTLKIIGDGKDN
jgi:hypothetical protein